MPNPAPKLPRTLLAAALAAALGAAPAIAGDHAWQVGNASYHVYFHDLDLTTAAGRSQALQRAERVAARLCAGTGVRREEQACVTRAVEQATGAMGQVLRQAALERERGAVQLAAGR